MTVCCPVLSCDVLCCAICDSLLDDMDNFSFFAVPTFANILCIIPSHPLLYISSSGLSLSLCVCLSLCLMGVYRSVFWPKWRQSLAAWTTSCSAMPKRIWSWMGPDMSVDSDLPGWFIYFQFQMGLVRPSEAFSFTYLINYSRAGEEASM